MRVTLLSISRLLFGYGLGFEAGVRSLHGPKRAQASSPVELKADPDRREGHNAWPSGAGRLCQNKGLAKDGHRSSSRELERQ
jgi:hypothetical protein